MNNCERPPHSGTQPGGLLSPWCQTSFTGPAPDGDAGNSYVTIIVAGASSLWGTGTFGDILWKGRTLDLVGQIAVILAGVFAVLALFRKRDNHD